MARAGDVRAAEICSGILKYNFYHLNFMNYFHFYLNLNFIFLIIVKKNKFILF